ncbi:MAG: alpha-amylase [Tissierellia bacterium]|nr:alpha-amylase [Tissierellia bacterium]
MINGVLFQTFEWETEADGNFYKNLKNDAKNLAEIGFTAVWIPPAYKGASVFDVGYTAYDYYDLGEFDVHNTVRTKYGTKEELIAAIKALRTEGISVYGDLVYNHKGSADYTEKFMAVEVDQFDRNKVISQPYKIEAWTGFDFPQRNNKYSDFKWHYYHFDGIDYDVKSGKRAIYKILGENKDWDQKVSNEMGNYDYLMNADIDHEHPDVRRELFKATEWFIDTTGINGIRYDAIKHINADFIKELSKYITKKYGDKFYFLGEYWAIDEGMIENYIDQTEFRIDLFDVPLHFNFKNASMDGNNYDMRKIFDNTLTSIHPDKSVTFVDNHDTQPGQSLESFIEPWFKEIAYALILFRKSGYPCIFAGDYYGIGGENPIAGHKEMLDNMLYIRKKYAYGEEIDYFNEPQLIGWIRKNENNNSPLVVLISTGDKNEMKMNVGEEFSKKVFVDKSGKNVDEVVIDENGDGLFTVGPGAVTYWTLKESLEDS